MEKKCIPLILSMFVVVVAVVVFLIYKINAIQPSASTFARVHTDTLDMERNGTD